KIAFSYYENGSSVGTTWPQEAWLFPYEGHSTALS
ncbi:mCG13667, partial [Mus musculus]